MKKKYPLKIAAIKVEISTDNLYLLVDYLLRNGLLFQHLDLKYKWSVKISTLIATIYLKGLLIRKVIVACLP